jgi:transglycosylase-like protein with SLT domain
MPLASQTERLLVLAEGAKYGFPEAELDAVIALESGWNPAAMNPKSKAVGLIQFMPKTLSLGLGYSGGPDEFRKLSAAEQAPYVGRFLAPHRNQWRYPGDTYLAVFAPKYLGASDSTILFKRGTKAWEWNPALRGKDGEITAKSVRDVLLRRMARGSQKLPKVPMGASRVDLLPVLFAALFIYAASKKVAKRRGPILRRLSATA